MSAAQEVEPQWAPRHRGWKLAHHLVPAFVMATFLLGLGGWALVLGSVLFGIPLAAFGLGTLVSVVREFRLDPVPPAPELRPVTTSTGLRAATYFAGRRNSPSFAAGTVGLGVIGLVAALAAIGRFVLLHSGFGRLWTVAGAIALGIAGFLILREGLRLLRLASSDLPPGVYLTRSRVVLHGPLGLGEVYWRDVGTVSAANPRGRTPLGHRGPAQIILHRRVAPAAGGTQDDGGTRDDGGTPPDLVVPVELLLADPNLLHRALVHYLARPGDRPELGTPAVLERLGVGDRDAGV